DAEGFVVGPDGLKRINLLATDDEDLNPTGWTWGVAISGTGFRALSFNFALPSDATVDLSTVVPVPGDPGQAMQDWLAAVEATQSAVLAAEDARDEADAAKEAAESVPVTNDGIMKAVAADPESEFSAQLNSTIGAVVHPVATAVSDISAHPELFPYHV